MRSYRGPQAIEEAFKATPPPRILHLATHGFFLPDAMKHDDADEPGAFAGLARLSKVRNPLLRSGIVLAGAHALWARPTPPARMAGSPPRKSP